MYIVEKMITVLLCGEIGACALPYSILSVQNSDIFNQISPLPPSICSSLFRAPANLGY